MAVAAALTLYGILVKRRQHRIEAQRYAVAVRSGGGDRHGRAAAAPHQIPAHGWWEVLQRVVQRISEDNLSVIAAGVAFYGLLSIFPALGALVAIYGLIADPVTVQQQISALQGFLPAEATKLVADQLTSLVSRPRSRLGVGLGVSVLLAIWGARAGTATLMSALNIAYGETEKRNFLVFNAAALALTAAMVLFGIIVILSVAILPAVINLFPLPQSWKNIISYVRWPILALLMMVAIAAIYRYAPSREEPRWRWVSWGAVIATLVWIAGSAGFSLYVAKFSSYNETYGSLGAVVILLMWLWVSAFIVLIGAELNAELEHQTARDTTDEPEKPMGTRGALVADTVASSATDTSASARAKD
jgi:membrane protein